VTWKVIEAMRKLDLAIVLAAIAGGTLLIEQNHRLVIDAPAAAEAQSLAAAAACPANDTAPYDSRCLDYLNVPAQAAPRLQVVAVAREVPVVAGCPDNDRVPYSQSCIAFLKGATETGMRWRVTE
jgi:hypothetical protein